MGSKSRSSSAQNTSNTSTSLAAQGDNNGLMASGNGNNFNITQTDHGLVDGLVSVWGDMAGNQRDMTRAAENMTADGFNFASDVNRDSLDFAGDSMNLFAGVNNDSLNFASDVNRDSLDLAGNLFSDSAAFGRDSLNVAGDALTDAFSFGEKAQDSAFGFGSDALNAMQDSQNQAFGFGSDALSAMQDSQSEALQLTGNLATDSINAQNALADTSIKENSDLARDVADLAASMHGNNTAFANNAILTVSDSLGDANNNMADLAYYSIDNNSNLARDFAIGSADLSQAAMDETRQAYEGAADQALSAHTQAMQFAENSMRSDGQQLAISTNETMKYIVIGLGGVAILAVVFMGRK
ncbi:hypothetical protein [Pseudoalteromonas sp. MelDa3]|uniref:hypothetical protein n=1 Tax=Pseudoalteromonas sp. MelDa3 TaxID=888435 RepID=UPI000CADC58C|nr:hypothetical protein [Pseudoalteromonas sp. MelDa3]PLT23513.1 hypothetical protein CXF89_19245 [Pseudoalteromonas sp. MelDa3]